MSIQSPEIVKVVREAWGWTGIEPVRAVAENAFGNLLVEDASGRYWRLCPEDLYCKVVAQSRDELDRLKHDPDFDADWCMAGLVQEATQLLGPLQPGRKFCLKIPGVLGGTYGGGNVATISQSELTSASGCIARQIEGLPDGTKIRLVVDGHGS